MSWSTSELRVRLAPLNRLKPFGKIFYWPFQGGTSFVDLSCFCSVLCLLCLCVRLFICALWSPAGKGLTAWLLLVVSNCEFVTFPLISWVRCGTWLYRFLIFAPLLTLHARLKNKCSNLNNDLCINHICDNPLGELCGMVEDAIHYFFLCRRYTTQRQVIDDTVRVFQPLSINLILFGNETGISNQHSLVQSSLQVDTRY